MSEFDYWDIRFLKMAELVSSWSKDPSTQVGAVIVRPDRTIASMGFNGFARGCDDDPALYADRKVKLSRIIHGEMNAILHAKEDLKGYTLYLWPPSPAPSSCDRCAAHVIQSGISRVVHPEGADLDPGRWKDALDSSQRMFDEAGVQVVSVPEIEVTGDKVISFRPELTD